MEERRPRERELVLAPNEYAYVLDTTKGHINCYVGPNKTSLAQTDEPVLFEAEIKRFIRAPLERAIQLFATAPTNWYVQLKNPANDGTHPTAGTANSSAELQIGRKINLAGPTSFALWPGQMAKVIPGHRIKRNQYVLIRIYDAEAANDAPAATWGLPTAADVPTSPFTTGERRVIRGTDCAFFIPPNGVEVVPNARGRYVRDAVTLGRLQYCVLRTVDGTERYVRGEAVVFPAPDEQLVERGGSSVFAAIELSEVTGIYVKVIAPYVDEQGLEHHEGEELFLTGANQIYFPRAEHAIIRYGEHEIYHAIAIPRGEGRYVLDRKTGEVRLVEGPQMFLPDPRREVVVRRRLSADERALIDGERAYGSRPVAVRPESAESKERGETRAIDDSGAAQGAAGLMRRDTFTPPRTLVLDDGGDGAVALPVRAGQAVQLVDGAGGRRVIEGPARVLLGYDETLHPLALSTGTPKSSDRKLRTALLQLTGNKISDRVQVTTSDQVRAELLLQYRVDFEGERERFFAVEDYVKLLCDQASSLIKAAARAITIVELQARVTEIVHDAVLGSPDEVGLRAGLSFRENGMRAFDVEVLEVEIADEEIAALLNDSQGHAMRCAVELIEREASLAKWRRVAAIDREIAQQRHQLELEALARRAEAARRNHELALQKQLEDQQLEQAAQKGAREALEADRELQQGRLEMRRAEHGAELTRQGELQELRLTELDAGVRAAVAQAQAFSPQLVAALNRLGDEQFLAALAQNFGELAAVEGRGLLETARKFLDFIPSSVVPTLRPRDADGSPEEIS